MKIRSLQIGITLICLSFIPAHAMKKMQNENVTEESPNCQVVFQRIKVAAETLKDYESRNGQILIGEINRYREYIRDLLQLYNRAKGDEKLNVDEELCFISCKYF